MNVRKADMLDKALEMLGNLAPDVPCEHLGTEYCEHLCKTDEGIYAACWDEYIRRLCIEDAKKAATDRVIKTLGRIDDLVSRAYDGMRELERGDYWDILNMVADVRADVLDITEEDASSGA